MIAAACGPVAVDDRLRIEPALAWSSGRSVCWRSGHGCTLADLDEPGSRSGGRRGEGSTVIHGWLDNREDIATRLGLPADTADHLLYDSALKAWGDEADRQLIGSYCAITALPDGRLRLVRSAWSAPPLHFATHDPLRMASSVLRVLFAAGVPREVDYDYVADQLLQDHHDAETAGWYKGISRVPLGTRIVLGHDGWEETRFYDPTAVESVRLKSDADYVEAARELIDRAAQVALGHCRRPGLLLSGGLDSAIVADALLRQMPADKRLPSFTFGPLAGWKPEPGSDLFADERHFVRAFAAMHPGLDPHFPASEGHDFDYRLRDLYAACDAPTANIANVGILHGPWEAARQAGCDVVLNADHGNFTFSNSAQWYPVELFSRGRWPSLLAAVRHHPGDPRSLGRKLLAHIGLPLLPPALRKRVRDLANPGMGDMAQLRSLLTPQARADHRRRRGNRQHHGYRPPRTRREWIMRAWHSADSGEDLDLGFERLYGMRRRDVTAWRPLIEFCLGLPTDQFVKGREHRRLARQLGKGIMPEAQRTNPYYGMQHADWQMRLGARRGDLAEYAARLRDHPFLAKTVDLARIDALLKNWPEQEVHDPLEALPRSFGITRALTAASFIGYAEGRNDF